MSSNGALLGLPFGETPKFDVDAKLARVKFRDQIWSRFVIVGTVDHSGPFWEATDDRRTVDGRRAWPAEYEEPVNSGRSADGR